MATAMAEDTPEYGVDVSFPMHHRRISDNFAWLPHNVDPKHNDVPSKYKDMEVSPLPGREEMYQDFIRTCEEAFGSKGSRCRMTEQDRIDMSLRQPQSMQVSTVVDGQGGWCGTRIWGLKVNPVILYTGNDRNFDNLLSIELHRDWFQEDQGSSGGFQTDQGVLGYQQGQGEEGDLGHCQYLHVSSNDNVVT